MRQFIEDSFKRGDLAAAFDQCLDQLDRAPDDLWLRHRAVLCLVKSGALERARSLYSRYQLDRADFDEDCLALGARLEKASAFETEASAFPAQARRAAKRYEDVFEITGGHYPGINAASMYLLAGDKPRSERLARRVLHESLGGTATDPEEAYYRGATQAEAHLLLGDTRAMRLALSAARDCDPSNTIALATSLQQLRLIADALGVKQEIFSGVQPGRPVHFAGNIFPLGSAPGEVSQAAETRLVRQIDLALEAVSAGPAFGAVAAGADILIAEAILRRGGSLNVVLPVPVGVFIESSVRPFGSPWIKRCEACLNAASQIIEVTSDRRIISGETLNFSSRVAMGLARMRAEVLATEPHQILVSDPGANPARGFGTVHDAGQWHRAGLDQTVIPFKRQKSSSNLPKRSDADIGHGFRPVMRAMLFIDISGSSRVAEDRVPAFVDTVLRRLVDEVDQLEDSPVYTDSWGDGLFLAFEQTAPAARAATRLREAFAAIDLAAAELPDSLDIRIGGHYGPVHEGEDPLQKRPTLFGAQVAIAARIEPCAVPGSICVSEAFAAVLAMEQAGEFRCEYIGRTEVDTALPKLPLFALRAVAPDSLIAQMYRCSVGRAESAELIRIDEFKSVIEAP
ncbi:adenylate/guanylate cyclase domain-containing protein [Maricaulis sp.]|uniref:adenylate/guanylate cyclase domain-containing protein n=1 Tax=Maricaulis sp. TaxID=1486257 RepID=UPI002635699C|nr:adenylate/guanylate cyclase domain-containing protein [Maricaulis sp.]